jgi:hypothetical protein
MVTTFLVEYNFLASARKLDRQRLGKQRVEAFQLLNNCLDLYYIAQFLNVGSASSKYKWIRAVASAYKQQNYVFLYRQGTYYQIPKECHLPKTLPSTVDGITYQPGDRVIRLGFVYHPATEAWLGYENALKEYINAHIQAFVERGYQNNMATYQIEGEIIYPPWSRQESTLEFFRYSLAQKEQTRNEPAWYRNMPEFQKYFTC